MADDLADPNLNRAWLGRALRHRDRKVLEWWLSSDQKITREFRLFLADLVAGRVEPPKLKRGGQKKTVHDRLAYNLPLILGELYVERLKRVWRKRYGRKRGIHEEAVQKTLAYLRRCGWPLKQEALANYLSRSRKYRNRIRYMCG
jgi:hypothetical protein